MRKKKTEDLFSLTNEEAKALKEMLNSTEEQKNKKIKTPLEKLGYQQVKESKILSQIRMRYEKDTTDYKKTDILEYRCKTIRVFNDSVLCTEGNSLKSFEDAKRYSVRTPFLIPQYRQKSERLTFDEIKAIAEMIELGIFNKLD